MDVAAVFPVPTSVEQIGTLRIAVIDGDPMLDGLVASASIVTEFEDQYLAELTAAVEDSLRSIRQLVVERLRARATIVKPIAASGFRMWGLGDSEAFLPFDASVRKRQFANPWHDEIGRFAPKGTGRRVGPGWGTDRKVTIEKLPRGHKHSVTTANGDVIELHDIGDVLSSQTPLMGSSDGQQVISDLLNGAADAHELSPGMKPPKIVVKKVDELIADMAALTGTPRDDWQRLYTVSAFVTSTPEEGDNPAPGWIFVNPDWISAESFRPDSEMPAMLALGPARFKVMHEYGHLRAAAGIDDRSLLRPIYDDLGGWDMPGMSWYGQSSEIEAHAEAFAEWAARGGGVIPAVGDYADTIAEYAAEFGWGEEQAEALAAAGPPANRMPIVIADSADGPIYIYEDGTIEEIALVASAGEFANPWHDEIGRFAPKGTGVKRLGPKTLNDNPDAYEPVDLEDQDAIRASLELWTADMGRELSDLISADVEVEIDKVKSYDSGEVGLDFTIRADGEDIGHMQRQLEPSPNARSEGWRGYAASLSIDDEMRGMGIGTVLQEGFENWAASQGIAAMGVFATMVGRYTWMRAGYDWRDTDGFREIGQLLGPGAARDAFRKAADLNEVTVDVPTPYELSTMLSRDVILSREFPEWDGVKPLRARELALAAAGAPSRDARLEPVRRAYRIWARQFPAAAEGDIVDPEAEAAWDALMADPDMLMLDDGLVAAGPFDLSDFNVMTVEEWATAFAVEAADIVGDVVVDSATGQALRPGLNVTDQVITDLMERHIGRLQDLGPVVQASLRDALELAIRNQLTLDEVVREIQATGPLGETAARAIARTELTAATNGGMLTGWRRDGFPFKQWRALHDGRTRHAHLDAHGQTVPTEQEFEVGGYRAQYPGDPRLPIHLRINCRCYMDRVGEGGNTITTRLADATRAQLYRLAQELNIPGRSKMRKDDLFQAIDRYRNGFGYTSLEEMNRAQLLIRARAAGIVGRSRMSKPELMIRLRDLATGRNRDRWLIDAGHGTREQLDAVRAQLREDLRSLIEGPILAAGPPPTIEKIETIRRKVFRRYGGADTGTAMCVGCGARLHWSNATRWEQMTLLRIEPKHAWSSKNAYPVCLADAAKLASLDSDKLAATFTIDNSWAAITNQFTTSWDEIVVRFATVEFANPWHDEEGKFAPKGTGTKYDAASVKGRVGAAVKAGSMVDRVGDPQATLETLDAWADKMGPEFDADEGVGMARSALSDVETGSKALIAKTKNGIAGIISYDYDPDSKMYMIHHLGTTGIARGVGTQLAAQVMVQAASNGAGVEFEAAQNDTAPDFWSSLGFDVTNPGHVVMSASDVGAWMRDFTS